MQDYARQSTTLSRRTPLTKCTGENLDHSAQNSTIIYETQSQYAKLKHCMRYFRPHFSTIAYINLDYGLQFSYDVYNSQPSHANLDTLLSSLACHKTA